MRRFFEFEKKNEFRNLIIVEPYDVVKQKEYLGRMKIAYRNLKLSRRVLVELMDDLFKSYYGTFKRKDGSEFEIDDDAIYKVFGKPDKDDPDFVHLECRFVSDWLKQPLPKQNGHAKLEERFCLMSIAMQLYDEQLAESFKE